MRFLNTSNTLFALFFIAFITAGCGGAKTNNLSATAASGASTASPSSQTENGIIVSSPTDGASVNSSFKVAASATTCQSQPVTSIGYSLDNSSDTSAVSGATLAAQADAGAGPHTLHVKAWNSSAAVCDVDVTVNVMGASTPSQSLVPANATMVSNIQNSDGWDARHDPGTNGSADGSMSMVDSPSLSGHARRFNTNFSGSGGEIYTQYFASDVDAKNFFYDAWVYLDDSADNIANLEMDMNQVLGDGRTIIFGFQCDGYSATWDYTTNQGSDTNPDDQWVHSNAYCDARTWGRNEWHHVQVSYSRDDSGNAIYHSVYLDGYESKLEVTVPSAFSLDWAPALMTNFQVDGSGDGSNTVYLDNLTISRW